MKKRRPKAVRDLGAEITAAILEGNYRPGEWLRQIDLEERFKASRFDVRKALLEVAARGTVSHVANRGYRVSLPDSAAVREVLEVRVLLEVEAATQALPFIGLAELQHIKSCQKAFERAILRGGSADQAITNFAFHDSIYRYAQNRSLIALIVEMRGRGIRGPIALWPSHADLQRSATHHKNIVAAIEAKDINALTAAVQHHIRRSMANYPPDNQRSDL